MDNHIKLNKKNEIILITKLKETTIIQFRDKEDFIYKILEYNFNSNTFKYFGYVGGRKNLNKKVFEYKRNTIPKKYLKYFTLINL